MNRQWTKEEIEKWYNDLPWLTGSNFLPSNVINRLDMWQSYKRDEHMACAEKELAFAEKNGFNVIRIWANFDVYYKEPDEFMKTLSMYIELARKYHQRVMMVLAYEEDLPYGDTFIPKELGPQKLYFNHFNRDYEKQDKIAAAGLFKHYMEYPEIKPIYLEMVTRIVEKYKNDDIVFCWNVENEPGIGIGDRAVPLLEELFALVRSLDPIQPLCADVWGNPTDDGKIPSKSEQKAFDLSDLCSFHNYSKSSSSIRKIEVARTWGKPVIVTEWLNRCNRNMFVDIYPYLKKNKIGSMIWGFVQGLTFTTEPWDSIWKQLENGDAPEGFDVTKWQHELFRQNLRPYDYEEYKVMKECNEIK